MARTKVSPEDALDMAAIVFEQTDSFDAKDWDRLARILAPHMVVDYTKVLGEGKKWDAMTSMEFIDMIRRPLLLGDPLVDTQHFVGASKFEQISPTEATGIYQMRVAHQGYTGPDKKIVEAKGHVHGWMQHTYKKLDGEWKLAGTMPVAYWGEHDFDKIFRSQ